ncbi:MAG: dTMP kinase [Bacillota bacterium]|nr:dTMP kinase [Bacillota bacterium]
MKGLFITFEGLDGSGKSTQIKKLCDYLAGKGSDALLTREPGGCPVSERIREIILNRGNPMDAVTEALLYAAARAEHVKEVIRPALEAGKTVISDRYVDSSIAYQGYGRGLGYEKVMQINGHAIDGLWPDITFYLKIPLDMVLKRITAPLDRLESEGKKFFSHVMQGYDEIAKKSSGRIICIDGTMDIDAVFSKIVERVQLLIARQEGK